MPEENAGAFNSPSPSPSHPRHAAIHCPDKPHLCHVQEFEALQL